MSRVRWTRRETETGHTGWINDQAPSGLAFVTPTRERPEPGEHLKMIVGAAGPTPRKRSVRVVHVEPYDRLFTLVACREETDDAV